jgi:hypothetical protein
MKQRYTARFTCPVENIIYYACAIPSSGFPCVKSSQGLYWFDSAKDALVSLCTLVMHALLQRKIVPEHFMSSIAPTAQTRMIPATQMKSSGTVATDVKANTDREKFTRKSSEPTLSLPTIHPWNWMELNHDDRCPRFSSFQSCPEGKKCRFAHVHYPQMVRQDRAPSRKALAYAYLHNFGITLSDPLWNEDAFLRVASKDSRLISFFRVRYQNDNHKRTWYTAAWKCPREGIIYYAAGARNGLVNSQNMFLYPSVEDAKLAVCGVVLNSFESRGLWGSWDEPPSNRNLADRESRELAHGPRQNVQPVSNRSQLLPSGHSIQIEQKTYPFESAVDGVAENASSSEAQLRSKSLQRIDRGSTNTVDQDEEGEILEELFS